MDCDRPLLAVCRDCDTSQHWRCQATSATKCAPCSERTRRLLERITQHGIADRATSKTTWLYFLTLTAPGERDHLRWYQGKRPARRSACECHRTWEATTRGAWNAQESAHWNRLRTSITRESAVQFIGAVEVQDGKRRHDGRARGLLHRHVVVASDRPLSHTEVQGHAIAAGYGCVLDLEPLQSPEKAARYIAKYVTKSAGERQEVAWERERLNEATGELYMAPSAATFRTWSSSHRWGYTMKGLRAVQSAQARARARYLREYAAAVADHPTSRPAAPSAEPAGFADPPP